MIEHSPETKVKATCDQLIARNFCCNQPAKFLVKSLDSLEYAIMCEKHKQEFEHRYTHRNSINNYQFYEWNLELNQKFADEAKEYWRNKNDVTN